MCSYVTEKGTVTGSGKGADGWFNLTHVMTYFDHPFHSPHEHTLNVDFLNEAAGPSHRVAVELTADSARELVRCIESALAAAGPAAAPSGGEPRPQAVSQPPPGPAAAPSGGEPAPRQ